LFYDLDVDGNTSLTGRKEMRLKGVGCSFGSDFVRLFSICCSACKICAIRNTLQKKKPNTQKINYI